MANKPILCEDYEALAGNLPKRFSAAPLHVSEGPFALFCPKGSVVILRIISKCLEITPSAFKPIFAVQNLTHEARCAIESAGGTVISLSDFHWSEESYKRIDVLSSSRVKRPLRR